MPEVFRTRRTARRSIAATRGASALLAALGLAAALAASPALAQFKWIGPDGTVTYGDRPPPGAQPVGQIAATARAAGSGNAISGLPYELRTAAQRNPVTLYTTPDCQPCEQARGHLSKRGIPFATREVRTQQDAEAFRALGFSELSFPALSVGRNRTVGLDTANWDRMLDIAGYPKTSQLPPRWQAPRSEPLARVDVRKSEPQASDAGDAAAPENAQLQQTPPPTGQSGAGAAAQARAAAAQARAAAEQPTIRF
jgi:glutaredoxin